MTALDRVSGLALVTLVSGCGAGSFEMRGASVSDVEGTCTLEGEPRVLMTQIDPRAGVLAGPDGDVVSIGFATSVDPHAVTVSVDPATLTILAIKASPWDPGASPTPVELTLPDHERIVAWTQGSPNPAARPAAPSVPDSAANSILGFEGRAVGRPAVGVGSHDQGVMAFVEPSRAGFQVVGVRVTCAAGAISSRKLVNETE